MKQKTLKAILLFCLIALFSCHNQPKNTENNNNNKDTDSLISVDTAKYKIEKEKFISLDENTKIAFIITEDGRYIAKASGGPIYECYCQALGTCSIQPEGRGILNCCCSNTCAKKQGDVTTNISSCAWRKVSAAAVSELDEILLDKRIALQDSLPKEIPYNAEGFRVLGNGVLEFEKPGLFKIVENDGKQEIILLKAAPQNNTVTCNCTCDSGQCQVTGSGTSLTCADTKTRCMMIPNGNPCNGCEWKRVASTGKN